MNLIQLEYFLMAAREKNFTSAAKKLYVSQPALSKQIALLEEQLQTKLFYREHRQVRLTYPGEILFEELTQVSQALQHAVDRVREESARCYGQLSIGCLETISTQGFLLSLMQQWQDAYPNQPLTTSRHSFRNLVDLLEEGRLDFIFTLSFEQAYLEQIGFVCHPVERREAGIVCAHNFKYIAQLRSGEYSLKGATMLTIHPDISYGGRNRAVEDCHRLGIEFGHMVECPNIASLLSMLLTGRGFATLDRSILSRADGPLEFFPFPPGQCPFYVICAWNERRLSPAGKAFRSLLLSSDTLR